MSVKHKKKSYLDILPRKGEIVRIKSEDDIRAMMFKPNTILYPTTEGKCEQLHFSRFMIDKLCGKEVEVIEVTNTVERYFMVRGWTDSSRTVTSPYRWFVVPEVLDGWS